VPRVLSVEGEGFASLGVGLYRFARNHPSSFHHPAAHVHPPTAPAGTQRHPPVLWSAFSTRSRSTVRKAAPTVGPMSGMDLAWAAGGWAGGSRSPGGGVGMSVATGACHQQGVVVRASCAM
jgi:hypothetical protein